MTNLQYRIQHCLQAILELQPALRQAYRRELGRDFTTLANYLDSVNRMELHEEEVARLEFMTEEFLREIRHSCGLAPATRQAH